MTSRGNVGEDDHMIVSYYLYVFARHFIGAQTLFSKWLAN